MDAPSRTQPENGPDWTRDLEGASRAVEGVVARIRSGAQPRDLRARFGDELYEAAAARVKIGDSYPVPVFMDLEGARYATADAVAAFRAGRVKGMSVADVSSGAGIQAVHFSFQASGVVAMDIDPRKVRLARLNALSYGAENAEFHLADALSSRGRDLAAGAEVIYSDPARPPEAPVREIHDLQPPLDRVAAWYSRPFIFDLPPQIEMSKVAGMGELEYISLGGAINRLTLYSPELARRERSAVALPGGARLEMDPDLPRNFPEDGPGEYIHEVDQSVYYAGLIPELCSSLGARVCESSKKRTFATSDGRMRSPFLRMGHVLVARCSGVPEVREVLRREGFGSVTLRMKVEPAEYWGFRRSLEEGLKGRRRASLMRFGETLVVAEPLE